MIRRQVARVAGLEATHRQISLSERVRAWLGLRPPLTPEELAAEPDEDATADQSEWSPQLRDWWNERAA